MIVEFTIGLSEMIEQTRMTTSDSPKE